MNSSLATADRETHLKIVIVALAASALFMSIAITVRVAGSDTLSAGSPFEKLMPRPALPHVWPPPSGKTIVV